MRKERMRKAMENIKQSSEEGSMSATRTANIPVNKTNDGLKGLFDLAD